MLMGNILRLHSSFSGHSKQPSEWHPLTILSVFVADDLAFQCKRCGLVCWSTRRKTTILSKRLSSKRETDRLKMLETEFPIPRACWFLPQSVHTWPTNKIRSTVFQDLLLFDEIFQGRWGFSAPSNHVYTRIGFRLSYQGELLPVYCRKNIHAVTPEEVRCS